MTMVLLAETGGVTLICRIAPVSAGVCVGMPMLFGSWFGVDQNAPRDGGMVVGRQPGFDRVSAGRQTDGLGYSGPFQTAVKVWLLCRPKRDEPSGSGRNRLPSPSPRPSLRRHSAR